MTSRGIRYHSISDFLAIHFSILAEHVWGCQKRMVFVEPDLMSELLITCTDTIYDC